MNGAPTSNQTGFTGGGTQGAFTQGPSQTNPFTADLKGEFTSQFGTNTNAVSQIFKDGGFAGSNRTKYMLIGLGVLLVLGVIFYVYTSEPSADDAVVEDEAATETDATAEGEGSKTDAAVTDAAATDPAATTGATTDAKPATTAATQSAPAQQAVSGDAPSLVSPGEGSGVQYNELEGPAEFSWEGAPGGHIVFSRSKSMSPETLRIPVKGNSYAFNHPWPGTWYWKVENGSGASEVRSFKVDPPVRRSFSMSAPQAGGTIAGNGGVVQWTTGEQVAFYRVEFSNGSFANPTHRFASSSSQLTLQGVAPGQYQMRLGAFSEVAGRWEYTDPVPVTVQ